MQKVSLPPIRTGIHISIAAKEPPERSWSKYKKVLIDNPRDSNLLQRQKLWNFQKLNRGAFRSQVCSLPDIPYRVYTNTVEKVNVAVQADLSNRFSQSLRVVFPSLATNRDKRFVSFEDDKTGDEAESDKQWNEKSCSPLQTESNLDEYSDDFEEESSADDPGLEFDSVVRRKNAGTMTDNRKSTGRRRKRRKSVRERNAKTLKSAFKPTKTTTQTSFVENIREHETPEPEEEYETKPETEVERLDLKSPELQPTEESEEEIMITAVSKVEITEIIKEPKETEIMSVPSTASSGPLVPAENVGHSSNAAIDPVSFLDFISGNITDRSRNGNISSRRRGKFVADPEADRVWFEKIVGDKDLVDLGTYENFARSRPGVENQSDSNNDRYNDYTKPSPRKNFTPRINEEFPAYRSVLAKSVTNKAPNNTNPSKASNNSTPNINRGKVPKRTTYNIGKSY